MKVEYLSYGNDHRHRLLTCGPRPATWFDIRLRKLTKAIGIQGYFTPLAYLVADDHNPNNQELVVYISFDSFSGMTSLTGCLTAYYVDHTENRIPMRFAIGKSSRSGKRHLVAWRVSLPEPPMPSATIEIVKTVSDQSCATISSMLKTGRD